jgi:hypothetical protein
VTDSYRNLEMSYPNINTMFRRGMDNPARGLQFRGEVDAEREAWQAAFRDRRVIEDTARQGTPAPETAARFAEMRARQARRREAAQ